MHRADARLLRGRLERRRELRPLRLEQLARLRAVDRREGARRRRRRAGRPTRARSGPVSSARHASAPSSRGGCTRVLRNLSRRTMARAIQSLGRLGRVGQRGVARLEQPAVHRDALERAGALDLAPAAHGVAHPHVERGEVALRVLARPAPAPSTTEQVVERARAPLVAPQRELARGGLDRVAPGGAEGALQRLVRAHEIEPAAHRREPAIGRPRLEPLRRRAPSAAPRRRRGAPRARSSPAR